MSSEAITVPSPRVDTHEANENGEAARVTESRSVQTDPLVAEPEPVTPNQQFLIDQRFLQGCAREINAALLKIRPWSHEVLPTDCDEEAANQMMQSLLSLRDRSPGHKINGKLAAKVCRNKGFDACRSASPLPRPMNDELLKLHRAAGVPAILEMDEATGEPVKIDPPPVEFSADLQAASAFRRPSSVDNPQIPYLMPRHTSAETEFFTGDEDSWLDGKFSELPLLHRLMLSIKFDFVTRDNPVGRISTFEISALFGVDGSRVSKYITEAMQELEHKVTQGERGKSKKHKEKGLRILSERGTKLRNYLYQVYVEQLEKIALTRQRAG